MNPKIHQMFQPIFRLLLFRGSPTDVSGNVTTIATFAILLLALIWLTLPTAGGSDLEPDVIADVRSVFMVIPLVAYVVGALLILTALNVFQDSSRIPKTLASCFGLLLLFQAGNFFLDLLFRFLPSVLGFIFFVVDTALMIWFIGAAGYVFQHAFNLKLYQGVLAVLFILFLSFFIGGIVTGIILPSEIRTLAELRSFNSVPIPTE